MGDVIDMFSRRKRGQAAEEKTSEITVGSNRDNPSRAQMLMALFFTLAKSHEEIDLFAERIELIGKLKSLHSISSHQRAKALEAIAEWDEEQIVGQLIGADKNLIQTKPALFIVALEKLLGGLMQL